jgi:hypothetical protein
MDAAEAEHVVATYREIAAHFGLKGPVQARVKAKRAGWKAEPQNHPADPLRIRVPRDAWNGGVSEQRGIPSTSGSRAAKSPLPYPGFQG